ncbi:hypothetical protein [Micromonospora sp. WMMD987]|uniref:hypothetical protein n=1 Tax=Micromonospora TaxID=1873 RepID=UPI00249BBC5C|nr:hypothetical protein [Micromonospora sp. WMMD987]WFE94919.1 hypothetical protein O7612_26965 [Micromonospora sp. WMMD987]
MRRLTDETVMAVGRLTLAATELEYLLADIGAGHTGPDSHTGPGHQSDRNHQADGDSHAGRHDLAAIFTATGGPVPAARRRAQQAEPAHRAEFVGLVEAAATYLVQSRTAIRTLWLDGNRVDAATFDEIAGLLLRCRERLQALCDDLGQPAAAFPRPR